MAMLVGEYSHQLDAKNRLRIPTKLKKALGDDIIFARGMNNCIYVFSKPQAEQIINEMAQVNLFDSKRQKSVRIFAQTFEEVKEDGQGRIILSPELRRHALIGKDDKELCICGAINRVEIWSKPVHDKYIEGDYDTMLESLFN